MAKFFKVLVEPNKGESFIRTFIQQINAECFIKEIDGKRTYGFIATPLNFMLRFSDRELRNHSELRSKLFAEASRLEIQARQRTIWNLKNPEWFPCEICGEKHENYNCCSQCNYNNHHCRFCGEDLGHSEVSACYITEDWDD